MTAPASVPLRIDFVSDVVCPWCAIGLASLEQALQRLDGEVAAEIHFQPFELNPQLPPEGEDIAGHLQRKYGMDEAQLAQNQNASASAARSSASCSTWARAAASTTPSTRTGCCTGRKPKAGSALKHALLRAYFSEGKDVSDRDTLLAIAASAGLDAGRPRDPRFRRIRRGSARERTVLPAARHQRRAGDHHRAQAPGQRRAAARGVRTRLARDRRGQARLIAGRLRPSAPAHGRCARSRCP